MTASKKLGTLFLVPTPLGSNAIHSLPKMNLEIVKSCQHFIVESLKLGKRHVLAMAPGKDLDVCAWEVMHKDTDPLHYQSFLDPALNGNDICLLSDAGSPTMADPGSPLVHMAHRKGVLVKPLVGPSSILLALMASGLNGQNFVFHGYLSPQKPKLAKQLRDLERMARQGQTQIFMETPYRNHSMLEAIMRLKADTLLCIAANLTTDQEFIQTETIVNWQRHGLPEIHKVPTIFLLGF